MVTDPALMLLNRGHAYHGNPDRTCREDGTGYASHACCAESAAVGPGVRRFFGAAQKYQKEEVAISCKEALIVSSSICMPIYSMVSLKSISSK